MNKALVYRQFGTPVDVLNLETLPLPSLKTGQLRVKMMMAPINPSDLIPITGAYAARIQLPQTAGYEGVGKVIDALPPYQHLMGKRVLPLRGPLGTWAQWVDCPAALAIVVPDTIPDSIAARAYINPLTTLLMLEHFPPDKKTVLLTAAGSSFARLLIQFMTLKNDKPYHIYGICRSHHHQEWLESHGVTPVIAPNTERLGALAQQSDLVLDAVGGDWANTILAAMPQTATYLTYGLLSGKLPTPPANPPQWIRFHLRDYLSRMQVQQWQDYFLKLWPLLQYSDLPPYHPFTFEHWKDAITWTDRTYQGSKAILTMIDQ